MIRKRRFLLGSTAAVATILVFASAAFACTTFRGNITVSGNGTGNVSQTIPGDPASTFQWCNVSPPAFGSGSTESEKESFWTARTSDSSPTLAVGVSPASVCVPSGETNNKLPAGTYYVGVSNGYWDESNQGFAFGEEDNCHSIEGGGTVGDRIDTSFTVGTNGVGSEVFSGATLNTAVNLGWNTVCVYLHNLQPFAPANAANFKSV